MFMYVARVCVAKGSLCRTIRRQGSVSLINIVDKRVRLGDPRGVNIAFPTLGEREYSEGSF